ncbi:Imm21 family immunity protein [Streptomyces sp. NPDC055189]
MNPSRPRHPEPDWVESMGGPLIVLPRTALPLWHGCTPIGRVLGTPGEPDDYDRACEADGAPAQAIPVGTDGAQALVLGDEPAMTCYPPPHRAFVRWHSADSDTDLLTTAQQALHNPRTQWEECGVWETSGPAVLIDSAVAGTHLATPDPDLPQQAPVDTTTGRWRIQATHTTNATTSTTIIRLITPQEPISQPLLILNARLSRGLRTHRPLRWPSWARRQATQEN